MALFYGQTFKATWSNQNQKSTFWPSISYQALPILVLRTLILLLTFFSYVSQNLLPSLRNDSRESILVEESRYSQKVARRKLSKLREQCYISSSITVYFHSIKLYSTIVPRFRLRQRQRPIGKFYLSCFIAHHEANIFSRYLQLGGESCLCSQWLCVFCK